MKDTFSEKLKAARLLRGLTMEELSAEMGGIVSKQSISKYEQGMMKPSSNVLIRISNALKLPLDYFFSNNNEVKLGKISFRNDPKMSIQSTQRMEATVQDMLQRYLALETLLNLNQRFVNPLKGITIHSTEEVEKAALTLRRKWGIGQLPIPSVYTLLENNGVKLIEFEADVTHVIGFSTIVKPKIPLVVINLTTNTTVERKRFTALHELGHLLLNFPKETDEKTKERCCNYFAGALLCPEEVFKQELGEHRSALTMDELIHLRESYGISIAAAVHRAKDLQVISESYYNRIFDHTIHQNRLELGWGSYPIQERTTRFDRLLQRAVVEEMLTRSRGAELADEDYLSFCSKMKQL
jgi:Zn-dependent peptidase ImmA (M78 family)/DNA-binding XRE family transcriptional regulator